MWTLYKKSVAYDITSYVSLSATDKEMQDSTLNSGSAEIGPVSSSEPYKPEDCRIVYSDDSSNLWFRLVSDSVKIVKRGGQNAYSHSIQFISLSRDLAFHCVRGMDFRQPKNGGVISIKSDEWWSTGTAVPVDLALASYKSDAVQLNRKMGVESGSVRITVGVFDGTYTSIGGQDCIGIAKGYSPTFVAAPRYVCSSPNADGSSATRLFQIPAQGTGDVALTMGQVALIRQAIKSGYYIFVGQSSGSPTFDSQSYASTFFLPVFISCVLELKTFYYTYYDVIAGILAGMGRPADSIFPADSYFSMPASGDFYGFISSTISPDFQFGQGMSAWECLCEVYRAFDALPTVDENGVLGAKYFNERSSASPISQTKVLDVSSSISDDKRANGLVCRYQNAIPDNSESFPCREDGGKGAGPRPITLGVPSLADFYFSPMKPVQSVSRLLAYGIVAKLVFSYGSRTTTNYFLFKYPTDLTDYVFEKSAWSVLPKSTSATRSQNQLNSVWYESGSPNGIYLGYMGYDLSVAKYAYEQMLVSAVMRSAAVESSPASVTLDPTQATPIPASVSFSVEGWASQGVKTMWTLRLSMDYVPFVGGSLRIEGPEDKKDGETLISQQGGILSLPKVGKSLLGTASQIGEPTKSACYPVNGIDQVPPPGSWFEDDDGALWIAQQSARSQMAQGWRPDVSFAKNFNQLSKKITIDRRVAFTAIEPSIALLSETIYHEYVYLSLTQPASSVPSAVHFSYPLAEEFAFSALEPSYANDANRVEIGVFRGGVQWSAPGVTYTGWIGYSYLPITSYSAGNCVCVEGGYDSPVSAGNRLTVTATSWFGNDLASDAVFYADAQGFADVADIFLCGYSAVTDYSAMPSLSGEPSAASVKAPFLSLAIGKRPNDIFRFNYEMIFIPWLGSAPQPRVMTYPALFAESDQVAKRPQGTLRLFAIYYSDKTTIPYSPFESQAYGTEISAGGLGFSFSASEATVIPASGWMKRLSMLYGTSAFASPATLRGWMVADANGSPLIACNEEVESGEGIDFYAFSSHNRL